MAERLRIGIVVGEASGDILGASLMQALKLSHPHAEFEGIGGPLMLAQGFNSHYPMERLAVMGLVEPLKRLPELLRIRSSLKQHFITNPPDLFLGIDAPDGPGFPPCTWSVPRYGPGAVVGCIKLPKR